MPSRFWKAFTLGCVPRADSRGPTQKVRFGVPLKKAFRGGVVPPLLVDLLVQISRRGVITKHIFRQPGNSSHVKAIVRQLSKGKQTNFSDYSDLTLASVVKKFLLDIPGGIFGIEIEEQLLSILKITNHFDRFDFVNKIIVSLPKAVQQFVVLVFGIWFRVVNHNEFNLITPEGMARSVAGCIFRNSVADPAVVINATKVMEILIDEFAVPSMFGHDNLQYFADTTCSGITVHEQYTLEYLDPPPSRPDCVNNSTTTDTGPVHEVAIVDGDRGDGCASGMMPVAASPQQRPPWNAALIPSQVTDRSQLSALCSSAPNINLPSQPGFSLMHHLSGGESGSSSSSSNQERNQRALSSNTPPARSHNNHYESKSLSRLDPVLSRQMARMQKRSQWFLTGNAESADAAVRSARDSVASDGAQSLAGLPASDDATREDEAADRGADSATGESSDDFQSVFADLDDAGGYSLGLRLGAILTVDTSLPIKSHRDTIRISDGALVHEYYRSSLYQPQAEV